MEVRLFESVVLAYTVIDLTTVIGGSGPPWGSHEEERETISL